MPSILSILKSSSRIPLLKDLSYLKLNNASHTNERQICVTATASSENENQKVFILPPEPQECCMSGCANCVWIKYAEEVAKQIDDGGEIAKAEIMKNVKDPNLRTFLLMELDHLFRKKDK